MPSIVADLEAIRLLAAQVQLAANYAGEAAASVHSGLGLGDLAVAATFDPAGSVEFEVAAFAVLTGPFALAGIESELDRMSRGLRQTATDYLEADQSFTTGNLFGGVISGIRGLDGSLTMLPTDGRAQVRPVGVPTKTAAPRSFDDLMTNLAALNDDRTKGQGDIDIQVLTGTGPAGSSIRKVVVYLPGTDSWNQLPGSDVNDLTTNERAILGERTTYEDGVLQAMRMAGVTADDDITFVAHSQGGAVAVNAARDAFESGEFNVTHVITAGAPIGVAARSLPSSTQVLAIENKPDIIPKLDGSANPVRPNITTVTVDHPNGSIVGNHDVARSYRPGAADIDASANPRIQAYRQGEAGVFSLDQATTTRFSITRVGG
jgi:hypothetical protein